MSPKDLCTIGFLNKMVDAGVRIFKIEGRARPAEYVKTVCECYHEALNACLGEKSLGNNAVAFDEKNIAHWKERLSTVFNRGFWDGYYLGQRLGEWSSVYGSKATQKKIAIGKVSNYFSRLGVGEFKIESYDLSVGDDILITGPTTGVIQMQVKELRYDLKSVTKVNKGALFSMPVDDRVRRGDKLFKVEMI
ncbi:hypothetical protein FACS1894195_4880 [Bacteroidia bacterium]|nr:hypothetical protein FACS1894195_4880 [Bacteroidia bacterium]